MAFEEDVVTIPQWNGPLHGFVRNERMGRFETLQVAAAANFHGDEQFVAVK
jgi:hypothetical protein